MVHGVSLARLSARSIEPGLYDDDQHDPPAEPTRSTAGTRDGNLRPYLGFDDCRRDALRDHRRVRRCSAGCRGRRRFGRRYGGMGGCVLTAGPYANLSPALLSATLSVLLAIDKRASRFHAGDFRFSA